MGVSDSVHFPVVDPTYHPSNSSVVFNILFAFDKLGTLILQSVTIDRDLSIFNTYFSICGI